MRRGIIRGLVLLALVVVGGLAAGHGMARGFVTLDLTRVPTAVPPYQPEGRGEASTRRSHRPTAPRSDPWPLMRLRGVSVAVPPGLRYPRRTTASGARILTDRWQTTWLSMTPRRLPSRWAAQWYRTCLYARRNPVGLLGKALLVPPMGTPTPQLMDQQIGPWQSYLYLTPSRIAADLFDGRHHVTVVYAGRRDAGTDLDTLRAIVASLRVTS